LVSLDLKTNLCRFLHAILVPAEAEGHQRPAVWKVLPTIPPFYPCWTILVGRISSVKWTGVQPVALRLGVIVFALFQIWHFKRVLELLIIEFPFCVSNEIYDDRRQKKCAKKNAV